MTHTLCILFPIAYRRRAYSGVLSKEVEATIDYLGIVNQEHDENPMRAGGIDHRQIKSSNGKAGAGGRHSLPPSFAPV